MNRTLAGNSLVRGIAPYSISLEPLALHSVQVEPSREYSSSLRKFSLRLCCAVTLALFCGGSLLLRKLASFALAGALLLVLTGCHGSHSRTKPADVDYYTCTMHPSVRIQVPDEKCPICAMDLIAVLKEQVRAPEDGMGHAPDAPAAPRADAPHVLHDFTIPPARLQQIGVTYAAVEKHSLQRTIQVAGSVTYDPQRHWSHVASVEGFVRQLFVSSPGETVQKETPLVSIYSPDLLAAQNELVNLIWTREAALANQQTAVVETTDRLIDFTKRRLRLWNISDAQIEAVQKTHRSQDLLTLVSPIGGIVQRVHVEPGRKVVSGDPIVDVADLSVVWIWAQFRQDDLPFLKKGLLLAITSSSSPGEGFSGKIAAIDPFLDETLRTARVRVDVENQNLKLFPGMYVEAALTIDDGESLAVPRSAVIPTGRHNVVFVDKGEGKLEPRFVELGRQYGDQYEVKAGLAAGERVVTSANFLIDAEANIQGAIRSW